MSSPVSDSIFTRPVAKRPVNLGYASNFDYSSSSKLNDSHQRVFSPYMNKEFDRLETYDLDVSNNDEEADQQLLDPKSKFYATNKKRRLKNKQLFPYKTETIKDQYIYLSHIIAHIYISAKSLDLKGNLTVSVEDLEEAQSVILGQKDKDEYIHSGLSPGLDGNKFETLHSHESEANEDDENEDDSDYYNSSEDEDDEAAENSTPILKVEPESASIITLKYWTKELKNLLKMGLVIPLSITAKLIKVYYAVCLSRGQNIDISFYTQALNLLSRERKLLIKSGLRLDWEPVYKEFDVTVGSPITFGPTMKDTRFKKLIAFALIVKPFFEPHCIPQLMEKIMTKFTNQNVSSCLIHLTVLLPISFEEPTMKPNGQTEFSKYDIRYYLPVFFQIWLNNKSDTEINYLLSLIMNICVEELKSTSENNKISYRGVHGIFTEQQFKFMINQLFLSSQIRHRDNRMSKYCKSIAQIVINSLSAEHAFKKGGVLDLLKTYTDAIFTMIHPSNSGPWSGVIAEVVKKLALSLHMRVQGEKSDRDLVPLYHPNYVGLPDKLKLNDSIIEDVVKTLLPLINLGAQAKNSGIRKRYNEALQVLCFMKPQMVLDTLLLDWYSSFESVHSTHRIPIVINQFSQLARIMSLLPVYRVHIPRLLSMLIPAIDSNDPEKTISTTDLITCIAVVIPFADLTEGLGDGGLIATDFTTQHLAYLEAKFYESAPSTGQFSGDALPEVFEYDSDFELEALKSATSSFKEFLTLFCENCFKFLETAPAIDDTSNIEAQACALISYCFGALMESVSDELFDVIADKFYEYVTGNVKHEVALVFCNIAETIVRRNPVSQFKRFYDYFMPQIIEEIQNGAGISRSQDILTKDQRLIWDMRILSGAISGATTEILAYLPDIQNFILSYTDKLKGTAALCAAMIASCSLSTISCLKPLEKRLISNKWLEEHGGKYSEECWGGFQFSDIRFELKYLDYKWYMPSASEVDSIADCFEKIATPSIDYIIRMSKILNTSSKVTLDETDKIGFHVELLEGLIKGVCCLFDQSYQEPILENKHLDRLKLLSRESISSSPSLVNLPESDSISSVNAQHMRQDNSVVSQLDSAKLNTNDVVLDDDGSHINPINKELEEEIEKVDHNVNIAINETEFESEIPTRTATPNLSDSIDAIDPTLTKRAPILYSYGSYFSDDLSKAVNPSYRKLHMTRDSIGKALSTLMKCLVKRDGSVELTSKVIQCTSTWLTDCGYYSADDELHTDNLHFVSLLELPGVFAPYTRTVLASRLVVYHCSRVSISCCTRLPTKLDKTLIRDLVSLSASPYGATAAHAASVLGTSLNRVMNCTSAIFNIFKDWELALSNNTKEILLNILLMFDKKKLRGLVEKSSTMLPKYEDLLFKSAQMEDPEVSTTSMRLFRSLKKYVKVPALVCIFDESMLDVIRPPDYDVDNKVAALKLAKAKKRESLLKNLENLVRTELSHLSKDLNWKLTLLIMELISTIQSHLEIPLQKDVLTTMVKYVDGSHPEISKKGMFWIASIMDTVESRAYNDYDLQNMLSLRPKDPSVVLFKEIVEENSPDSFLKEIQEVDNPAFFIDNKQWVPLYPWNKELYVVKPMNIMDPNFNENDKSAVKDFAAHVTKEWLILLLKTHIDESESTSAFLPGIVYFFTSITNLIIYDYIKNVTLLDLFAIADELFKSDEKPTHVAVSELFCGILFACKNNDEARLIAEEQICIRIKDIFEHHLSQSTYNTWTIFSWWLSSHFDFRRTPRLLRLLCNFEVDNDHKKSPFALSCRLVFLEGYLDSSLNKFHDFDELTHRMFQILAHPYDVISKEASAVLFNILFYRNTDKIEFDDYISEIKRDETGMGSIEHAKNVIFHEHFKHFFTRTIQLAKENKGKTPQEIVNSPFMYHVKGLSSLLLRILKTSLNIEIVDYIRPYILPLVLELDDVKDACNLAEINVDSLFLILGSIRFKEKDHDTVIEMLETNMGWTSPKLTQYKHVLAFFGVYGTVRFLERTTEQRKKLMEITYKMLFNRHVYLREQYAQNVKLFIHLFLQSEKDEIIQFYIKKFKRIIRKNKVDKNIKLTSEQVGLVHGATLGLRAIVEAFPYTTPPPSWLPDILSILEVKCAGYPGVIGRAAKDALSQFKKTRQDTWHIDSKFFTEQQLEDLEGVLYKSYYL
ncbi:hypothetical protein CANINC_004511 [Pichia inconspicua]|uniref:Proteasome activator Blm10 mid region domain-containing protein n=1 Tax=Pichia inconspicua TaxID=52247 RepID=A0A4T0WX05_9ASCO|nr:hypothetical protein CANINC_004511 [[Candida] inconspicua]